LEGDFDLIQVVQRKVVGRRRHLSIHPRGFTPQPITLIENHVHVWVALGSHANFSSPYGPKRRIALFWKDTTADGGEVWHTERKLKPIDDTNFADYVGRWGDGKSPRGPRNPYNDRERNTPLVKPILINP